MTRPPLAYRTSLSVSLLLFLVSCCFRNAVLVAAIRRLPNDQRAAADRVLSSFDESTSTTTSTSVSHRRLESADVTVPTEADDHLVTGLPLLSETDPFPTKHWAGLLPASEQGDKYLFYWLFASDTSENEKVAEEDIPLVIWLNGGPGCSSMDGLFLENGPLRFQQKSGNGDLELVPAKFSWHKAPAYMLYIDQPVGTGLSFTTSRKYPRNDKEVDTDFYYFLQSFFKLHADKFVATDDSDVEGNQRQVVNRGFYFSGESHAGHYIPSMMAYILDQNDNVKTTGNVYIALSGAAIGNGWVDPFHQYAAAHAAYGHGIIDRAQMAALDEKEKTCQSDLNQNRLTSAVCFNLLDDIVGQSMGTKSNYKVSQYDVRQVEAKRGSRDFPPGHKTVEAYLGGRGGLDKSITASALEAIHATPSKQSGQIYQECTDPPYDALSHQDGLGVVNEVVKVLHHEVEGEDAVRLLFFNGVTDLICNHVGNEVLLEQLPWQYQQEWTKAKRTAWVSQAQEGNSISGYIKEFKNLLFLKIMESGHMVPMDVPDVALDMMKLFLYGGDGAFQYSPQNLDRSANTDGQCPSCPTCLTNFTNYGIDSGRESTESATASSGKSSAGSSSINLWIGLGLAATVVVGLILYKRKSSPGLNRIPAYDLEMRGGTFSDQPFDDDLDIAKETRED